MATQRRSEPVGVVGDVPSRHRDEGTTLVEIMISIVLIGMVLAAVLSAVQLS
ncbi:type II secretion system protein, partial [Ilumatobacter sp.]|uniref:type II secretion system protein n=1 Tax=Ilumatobacter sp. TaxID=1967498 RepID=UPI003C728360